MKGTRSSENDVEFYRHNRFDGETWDAFWNRISAQIESASGPRPPREATYAVPVDRFPPQPLPPVPANPTA